MDPDSITFVASQLDCVLQTAGSSKSNNSEEQALKIVQVFDSLCKEIRALDLPLKVNSIQGISPIFRGAEVCKSFQVKHKHAPSYLADLFVRNIRNSDFEIPRLDIRTLLPK